MHLVFYGSETSGKVTINADGVRLTLTRRDDGQWSPSSEEALATLRRRVPEDLGAVLALLVSAPIKAVPS